MSFKYFRPTVLNIKNVRKAPAFKNTASASDAARVDKFQDHFDANNLEGRMSKFDLDRGHSVLKESGLTRSHSILETSFGDKLAGRDSNLGDTGKQNESQFGEDGLRSAGELGKGMAGEDLTGFGTGDPITDVVTCGVGIPATAGAVAATPASAGALGPVATITAGTTGLACLRTVIRIFEWWSADDEKESANNEPTDDSSRPGVDDNGGGGTLDARGGEKLSQGLNKDPIINPNGEDLGGGYLSDSQLKQMESDLRNAKDPATNWGEEHYDNFNGTVVMDRMAVSLKAPATNWGNDYTSTVEVIETMITAPDVF